MYESRREYEAGVVAKATAAAAARCVVFFFCEEVESCGFLLEMVWLPPVGLVSVGESHLVELQFALL